MSLTSGIGTYIAFKINSKFKKDDKWTSFFACNDKDEIKKLGNYLKQNGIKYICNLGYTRNWEETYNLTCFSKTKDESRIIEKYFENNHIKCLKEILK